MAGAGVRRDAARYASTLAFLPARTGRGAPSGPHRPRIDAGRRICAATMTNACRRCSFRG